MAFASPPDPAWPAGWQRLRVTHLLLLVPWVGLVVAAHRPLRDNSFLWHVRAGSVQLSQGAVIRADPFSFTFGGAEWRTQSWLADVGYGLLEDWFALAFVPALILATTGITLVMMGLAGYRRAHNQVAVAVGLVVATWLGSSFFSPRPVLFSYLLLALLVVLLDLPRARWALPFVIWLWASVHGSFVLGIGLIFLEGLRTRDRRRLVDASASTVAATLTAHGLAIWGVLADFVRNREALDLITEWAPPDLLTPGQLPYVLVIAGFAIAAASGRLARGDLWVPLPFLLFGLTSARALFPAAIVVLPWALLAFPQSHTAAQAPGRARAAFHVVLAAGILVLPFLFVSFAGLSPARFPLTAAGHLTDERTFHDDVTGGYLIWLRTPVYVDDRAELYGKDFFEEFISVRNARPGWEETLAAWDVSQALVKDSEPLAAALPRAGWTETYRDDDFVVFVAP